nr:PREDICTED: nuclear body protein SP140-like protein [Latimeria chalumnae]|eukprot:XP_014348183.1 PREDICTED: nuclear body protein SP140-like protein [Latimeria chalumnae]
MATKLEAKARPRNEKRKSSAEEAAKGITGRSGGGAQKSNQLTLLKVHKSKRVKDTDNRFAKQPVTKGSVRGATRKHKRQKGAGRDKQVKLRKKASFKDLDFSSAVLPITCGSASGMLHKEKLANAVKKCIHVKEKDRWFSPTEFEEFGGRKRSKNWKISIRCGTKTLKQLIEVCSDGVLWEHQRSMLHMKSHIHSFCFIQTQPLTPTW